MSAHPKVAVLLANFNGGRFLDEAIASVVAQTFRDWEMVVVDTGSDDESVAILERWAALDECGGYDDRYRYCEDLELWFRVGRRWEVRNLPQALTRYRVWTGSLTTRRLTTLVWRSWIIRMWRAPALGYEVPLGARVYSCLSFGVLALPPFTTRRLYEFVVQQIGDRVEGSPGQSGDSHVGHGSSNTSSSKNRT